MIKEKQNATDHEYGASTARDSLEPGGMREAKRMPITHTAEREAEIRELAGKYHGDWYAPDLLRELDAERAAHQETQEKLDWVKADRDRWIDNAVDIQALMRELVEALEEYVRCNHHQACSYSSDKKYTCACSLFPTAKMSLENVLAKAKDVLISPSNA